MEESTINLSELIYKSINELFLKMFSSIDNTIYKLLDDITFITPSFLSETSFQKIMGTSSSNGILLICNSLVFGLVLYYAINYLISHLTYSKIDTPKQFIFKTIIFVAITNSSLWICEQIINIVSIITGCISDIGTSLFNYDINFSNFIDNINKTVYLSDDAFNLFSFNGIIKSFTTFGLINLIFTYSLRYIMIQVFVLLSPFAFLSLITNSSEWFFKIWIKSFLSLLLLQILVSLILLLSFSIDIAKDSTLSKLLFVGIIYALTKASNYMRELFGGISTTINTGFTNFKNN